jgi:hypothetical protein
VPGSGDHAGGESRIPYQGETCMQNLEDFTRACRSYADREYALPDIVDISLRIIEADFECGYSPEHSIDVLAQQLGLVQRKDWTLERATELIARIARPVITTVVPFARRRA